MDARERALTREYNKAVAQLRGLPEGDPKRARAVLAARYWQGALYRYRRSQSN